MRKKIVVIGPDINSNGGVAKQLSGYPSIFAGKVDIRFLYTYKDASKLKKIYILFLALVKLVYLFLSYKPDLIHIHCASNASFYRKSLFVLLCRLFRFKYIFHIHGGGFEIFYKKSKYLNKLFIKHVLINSKRVIVVSQYFFNFFSTVVELTNITLIHNYSLMNANDKSRVLPKAGASLLYMGRISRNKGFLDFCNVAKALIEGGYNLTYYIAGIDEEGLLRSEEYKSIESNCKYLGWVNELEKKAVLEKSTLLLSPSYFESFGLAALEASLSGVPVVAYNVGGLADVIVNGQTGLLAHPGDLDELERAVRKILDSERLYSDLSKSGLTYTNLKFSESVYTRKLTSIYLST
ncbi:hypothetical protein GCM10009128_14150 [Psychrosphaera haliotis]|uniref:glycosyltransferase family 4 protein n=1 Tax=Psychrosphaera haliotis TaxID=555083 RepID=UPI0031D71ABB